MKKIKRPMLYETDDVLELEQYYSNRLLNLFSGAYAMNQDSYGAIRASIEIDFAYDKEVLNYRQLHRKAWLKHRDKVLIDDNEPQEEPQEEPEPTPPPAQAEEPTKTVICTALDIIDANLLTSPTEAGHSATEVEEA